MKEIISYIYIGIPQEIRRRVGRLYYGDTPIGLQSLLCCHIHHY